MPGLQRRTRRPPPEERGFKSQQVPRFTVPGSCFMVPGSRVERTAGTAKPRSRSARARACGSRTRRSTAGGLPQSVRPRASVATALGWFSKLDKYVTASHSMPRPAWAAAWAENVRGSACAVTDGCWSMSAKASMAVTRKPARAADSAAARVDTPATSTCGDISGKSEPRARRRRGDDMQMIEHRARGFADAERVHKGR